MVTRQRDGTVNISDLAFRTDRDPVKEKRAVNFFAPTQYPDPFPRLSKQNGFFTVAGRLAIETHAVDHKEKLLKLGVPLRKAHRRQTLEAGHPRPA